jgi:PAS domain S-box-containing protein
MPYFIQANGHNKTTNKPNIPSDWAQFLDITPALVWVTDTQGNLLHANAAWREATGVRVDEADVTTFTELVHPDDRSRIIAKTTTFAGSPTTFEFRMRQTDGSFRWMLERIQPWRDGQGQTLGYIGTSIDIQSQKEHEQKLALIALRQTSLTYFSRFALAQNTTKELDEEALRLFCENLGLTAALLILGEAEEAPQVVAKFGLAVDETTPKLAIVSLASEFVLEYPSDASDFPLSASWLVEQGWNAAITIPLDPQNPKVGCLIGLCRESKSEPIGPIHYARDLAGILAIAHERRRAEAKLRESEQRALQVQKMESVGLLAGGVAHDFNNLLTAIRCFADLLRDELTEPAQLSKIDDILHASSRASHLVRQLLSFSRQEIHQSESLDLNQVIDELRGFIRSLLSEHVSIDVELADRAAWCIADRKQIEQILFNLCLNARDVMTTEGRLVLSISIHTTESGGKVRLSVSDSGPGIRPEVQKRIFEPFFTTKARGHGTGLGLATSLAIAKNFGGSLTFETLIGKGTVFHLDLPEIADPLINSVAESRQISCSAPVRIMLVEDDDLVRAVTIMLAQSQGHQVISFSGSKEALVYVRNVGLDEIDLLITDIVMPGINGRVLAENILSIKPDLPVFYMSGFVDDPATQEALKRQDVCFLPKPFSSEEFLSRLALILKEKYG